MQLTGYDKLRLIICNRSFCIFPYLSPGTITDKRIYIKAPKRIAVVLMSYLSMELINNLVTRSYS